MLGLLSAASSVLGGGGGPLGGGEGPSTSTATSGGGTFTTGSMGGQPDRTWLIVAGLIVLAFVLGGRRHG